MTGKYLFDLAQESLDQHPERFTQWISAESCLGEAS
jgi:hypothetical protein